MQNSLYIMCDACPTVLEGKSGTADMHKDYISLRGSLCVYDYDAEEQRYNFTYAHSSKDDNSTLHFCNFHCMASYMSARQVLVQQSKTRWQTESY